MEVAQLEKPKEYTLNAVGKREYPDIHSFRLTRDETEKLFRILKEKGESKSLFLRNAVLQALREYH